MIMSKIIGIIYYIQYKGITFSDLGDRSNLPINRLCYDVAINGTKTFISIGHPVTH